MTLVGMRWGMVGSYAKLTESLLPRAQNQLVNAARQGYTFHYQAHPVHTPQHFMPPFANSPNDPQNLYVELAGGPAVNQDLTRSCRVV